MTAKSTNTVDVKILDKDYLIACPADAENGLRNAAFQLDRKMREIKSGGKVFGTEKIAVMAALNLTYELIEQSQSNEVTHQTVTTMHEKIDALLANKR